MVEASATEMLRLLAKRGKLLSCIDKGITDRRVIQKELDVSRSTVNRGIRELTEADLIGQRKNLTLTSYGQRCLRIYFDGERLVELKPLLDHFPNNLPDSLVFRGEPVISQPPHPHQPIDDIVAVVESAHELKILSPVLLPSVIEELLNQLENDEIVADFIVSDTLFDILWVEYEGALCECLSDHQLSLGRTPKEVPFGLFLAESGETCVSLHDDSGRLVGITRSLEEDASNWALDYFHDFKQSAESVFLRGASQNRPTSMRHSIEGLYRYVGSST